MNNSIKLNRERVFNLKEIGWLLEEQWKAVACFSLVVMLLFLGFMQWRYSNQSKMIANQQEENLKKTDSDIIGELPAKEQNNVTVAYDLHQQAKASENYMHESRLMKMNPYHARRFKTDWVIIGLHGQEAALAEAYMLYMKSDTFCKELLPCFEEKTSIETVKESLSFNLVGEKTGGAFSCNLYLSGEVDERTIQKAFALAAQAAQKKISDEFGEHQFVCFNQEVDEGEDLRLAEYQKAFYERLTQINAQLNDRIEDFSQEQKEVYERLISAGEEVDYHPSTVNNALS